MSNDSRLLALDIGTVRIGVAQAGTIAKLASPLTTIENNKEVFNRIQELIDQDQVSLVVVGLPQNRNYQDTDQTRYVRDFVEKLKKKISVDLVFQDEADTSKQAESNLKNRGKTYEKADIDSEAAAIILQDYIEEHL